MEEKTPEDKKQKKEDIKEAKVAPIHPGDSRLRPKRHLLDTCE